MLLNNKKNIELLRKGLYSEELKHYSQLCTIYEDLISSTAKNPQIGLTTIELASAQRKYSAFFEAASKGDFSYIQTRNERKLEINGDGSPEILDPQFSALEEEYFRLYAYHSQKLAQMREGSERLAKVLDKDVKTGKDVISQKALEEFKDFMVQPISLETKDDPNYMLNFSRKFVSVVSRQAKQAPSEAHKKMEKTRKLMLRRNSGAFLMKEFAEKHSPRWLGFEFCKQAKDSLNVIDSIDPNHLPEQLKLAKNFTPAQFGAEITGVKGSVQKFFEKFVRKEELEQEDPYNPFTNREQEYLSKKPGNFSEKISYAKQKVSAALGSISRAKKAVFALALCGVMAVSPLINTYSTAHEFDEATKIEQQASPQYNPSIMNMTAHELDSVITDFENNSGNYETLDSFKSDGVLALDAIIQTCQSYQTRYQTPTLEEATIILNSLDDVTSLLVEKPIEFAIQEEHPDFSNITADLFYNDTIVDPQDFTQTTTEEGFNITFVDEYGNPKETTIHNVASPLLGKNDMFGRAIQLERGYDSKYNQMLEALSSPNAINPETGKTYTYEELSRLSTEFFQTIIEDANVAKSLTVPEVQIDEKGNFVYVLPEQEQEVTQTTESPIITESPTYDDGDER